jgi:hypothetical protein
VPVATKNESELGNVPVRGLRQLDGFRGLLNGGTAEERAAEAGDAIVQQEIRAIVPQGIGVGGARAEAETGARRWPKGGGV